MTNYSYLRRTQVEHRQQTVRQERSSWRASCINFEKKNFGLVYKSEAEGLTAPSCQH